MSPRPRWQSEEEPQEDAPRIEIPLEVRRPMPPWQQGHGPGDWGGHGWNHPHWQQRRWKRSRQRQHMFARMAASLILIVLLGAGFLALASHIYASIRGEHTPLPFFFFLRFCGLALLLPALVAWIVSRIFRSYAVPLADIMDAAEEVASGNLQVRVAERGSSEFQRLAASFNRMTEELARIDQQRRNLTADVAHELRTPLHIIQGNLEGILDGVYAPTPEHIEATLQETRTLARLVDDLRTLSLAESGQLPLHPELVDVHDLLADVATSFSPQAESANVELCVEADESIPMTLYGDPGRLDQVLSNLVSNALRHTPAQGKITLGATLLHNGTGQSDGKNGEGTQIQLTVTDTGEGIPAEDLPFIFDRFWRGDRARTHKEGAGSGLGLAITGQLVKAHGGTITVASTPGSGTTFTVTLPAGEITHV
jgi:two-component system sensor histidine kinase BaeS